MNRDELAHILRAAVELTKDHRILVLGSQAILASIPEDALPERVTMSMEADIAFFDDAEEAKSDAVDGAIGEGSPFHQTFGYYAQGVGLATAVMPAGWESRAVPYVHGDFGDADALCPEIHDLVVSKLVAGREKDIEYAAVLLQARIIDRATLSGRADSLPVIPGVRRRVQSSIDRLPTPD